MGIGDLGLCDFRLLSSRPIFMSPYTERFKRVYFTAVIICSLERDVFGLFLKMERTILG